MKTFVYLFSEGKPASNGSGTKRTVRVWRIVKNKPVPVGELTQAYASEFELVMDCLRKFKALPDAVFERNVPNGTRKYKSSEALREAAIADIHSL